MTRARVRKDTTPAQAQAVPWVVRAAATLPRPGRVSNPLLGETIEGTTAVLDVAACPDLALPLVLSLAKAADAALVVFDDAADVDLVRARGFTPFRIEGCDRQFAANYDLPAAGWIKKAEKADLSIAPDDPGHLQPEQERRARRVRTKTEIEITDVGLVTKSAQEVLKEDDEEERYVLGVVLEPDEVDSQGDTISEEEIRSAAHRYMEGYGNVGLQHQVFVNDKIKILESYVTPVGFEIEGQTVKKGTWLMAFRILDDAIWQAIKEGRLTGLSIGGTGLRLGIA